MTESSVGLVKYERYVRVQRQEYALIATSGRAVMTFLIISTIAGIMLALRFKVVVLGPAILLATAVITMSVILSGHKAGAIALTVFGTAALLQIGYISGCILHALAQSSGSRQHRGLQFVLERGSRRPTAD